jgi:hypothetical protein
MRAKGGMRKYVQKLSEKQRGQVCHRCSEELRDLTSLMNLDTYDKLDVSKCLSCQREVSLFKLLNVYKSHLDSFEKFILSKKFDKYNFYILLSSIVAVLLSILIKIFVNESFSLNISNIILTVYWLLYMLRIKLAFK